MKVQVDQLGCTGSGLCELNVPEVFVMGADGLATVKDGEEALPKGGAPDGVVVAPELAESVRDAAEACPGRCISCTDA